MQKTKHYDDLDNKEKEIIQRLQRPWQRTFLKRFYEQLQKQKLRKKDIPILLNSNSNKSKLLSNEFVLPENTLTNCTKFDSKHLRTVSVDTLIAISLALYVSPNYLLGFDSCEPQKTKHMNKQDKLAYEILSELIKNKDRISDDNFKTKVIEYETCQKDASKKNLERPF